MSVPFQSEAEIWNALRQAQEEYTAALEKLDAMVLGSPHKHSEAEAIALASQARTVAYRRYRQALNDLLLHLQQNPAQNPVTNR